MAYALMDTVDLNSSHHFLGAVIARRHDKLTNSSLFISSVTRLLKTLKVTCLGVQKYEFTNQQGQTGFTAIFLLAESHIAIHTWPEHKVAELDVYLCNYLNDNRKTCEAIFDGIATYFDPVNITKKMVERPRVEKLARNGVGV